MQPSSSPQTGFIAAVACGSVNLQLPDVTQTSDLVHQRAHQPMMRYDKLSAAEGKGLHLGSPPPNGDAVFRLYWRVNISMQTTETSQGLVRESLISRQTGRLFKDEEACMQPCTRQGKTRQGHSRGIDNINPRVGFTVLPCCCCWTKGPGESGSSFHSDPGPANPVCHPVRGRAASSKTNAMLHWRVDRSGFAEVRQQRRGQNSQEASS